MNHEYELTVEQRMEELENEPNLLRNFDSALHNVKNDDDDGAKLNKIEVIRKQKEQEVHLEQLRMTAENEVQQV
jgi:hypothetical protein